MKRILALLLALMMLFALSACKDDKDKTKDVQPVAECTEQDIRQLVEKNLNCYFAFYVSPIDHTTQQNSDGYYGAVTTYFADYQALEELVQSTYTSDRAQIILNHPKAETPLYKNVGGKIFVDPTVIEPVEYKISWDDSYTIEILTNSTSECTFRLTTTDFDGKEYVTEGAAAVEDGKWQLTKVIY